MQCKVHKEYRALRAPRVPCPDCWRMFIIQNAGDSTERLTLKQLLSLIESQVD